MSMYFSTVTLVDGLAEDDYIGDVVWLRWYDDKGDVLSTLVEWL